MTINSCRDCANFAKQAVTEGAAFCTKIVLKDNVIVGITLVNDIEKAETLFHLMKSCANVKKFKQELLSENFGIATLPSSLRKKLYPGGIKCEI